MLSNVTDLHTLTTIFDPPLNTHLSILPLPNSSLSSPVSLVNKRNGRCKFATKGKMCSLLELTFSKNKMEEGGYWLDTKYFFFSWLVTHYCSIYICTFLHLFFTIKALLEKFLNKKYVLCC